MKILVFEDLRCSRCGEIYRVSKNYVEDPPKFCSKCIDHHLNLLKNTLDKLGAEDVEYELVDHIKNAAVKFYIKEE